MAKVKKSDLHEVTLIVRDINHFYQLVSTSNRIFGHGKWRTQKNTVYRFGLGFVKMPRKWFVPDLTAIPLLKLL